MPFPLTPNKATNTGVCEYKRARRANEFEQSSAVRCDFLRFLPVQPRGSIPNLLGDPRMNLLMFIGLWVIASMLLGPLVGTWIKHRTEGGE